MGGRPQGRKSYQVTHMSALLRISILAATAVLSGWPGHAGVEPQDLVSQARALAFDGHRAEALQVLEKRLSDRPTDSDAQVLRGIILSWEGRYHEARLDLEAVLARHPGHGDALPALINVEMWSDRPARAEELAREGLKRNPNDPDLLVALARALKAQNRKRDALQVVRHVLAVDPGNKKAADMESSLGDSLRHFTASIDHSTQWYSDGRSSLQEEQVQLSQQTAVGSVMARFSHANQYGEASQQVEIDAYPHLRPGTYAYVNVGYSPDANLYPKYRVGSDLYQSLGGGFEASGGFRQLHFSGNVHIYTASLTKYYGDWMFTSRVFLTPDTAGTSHSVQFQARRYLGNGTDYLGVRYGYGSSPVEVESLTDILVLNSQSFAGQFYHGVGKRVMLQAEFGYSRQDRLNISGLRQYLADASMFYRF